MKNWFACKSPGKTRLPRRPINNPTTTTQIMLFAMVNLLELRVEVIATPPHYFSFIISSHNLK
jgi:hypothetical protein